MRIRIFKSSRRSLIVCVGIPGLLIIAGVVALLYMITPPLTTEQAIDRVRLTLLREVSQEHMTMLKEEGAKLLDFTMAKQWEKEMVNINNLKFKSVEIKRPIPDILFSSEAPTYVVRIIFIDGNSQQEPRYFWLSWDGVDREISKLAWIFSI